MDIDELYALAKMPKPKELNDFQEISSYKVEAGIKAAKESIWKHRAFQNLANPGKKRLQYMNCRNKQAIHPDSDSDDYPDLD